MIQNAFLYEISGLYLVFFELLMNSIYFYILSSSVCVCVCVCISVFASHVMSTATLSHLQKEIGQ